MATPSHNNREAQRMGWLYATALTFVISVAVFTVIGYLLDRWLKTTPWCLVGGLVLGLVGGTMKFVKDGLALNKEVAAETRAKGRHTAWKAVEPDPKPEGESSDDLPPR